MQNRILHHILQTNRCEIEQSLILQPGSLRIFFLEDKEMKLLLLLFFK